jgi:GH35 family endo-1,4-beta-xylanase
MDYKKFATHHAKGKSVLVVIIPLVLIAAVFLIWRDYGTTLDGEDISVCHTTQAYTQSGPGSSDFSQYDKSEYYVPDNGFGIAAGGDLIHRSQKELDAYFKELKRLGVSWVRWDIDWEEIQPDNADDYRWEATDRVAITAQKNGIQSLGIIAYAPDWAEDEDCPDDEKCPPADPAVFARFARTVAARYGDFVSAWEIWNEPNHRDYWYPEPDAGDYARILKAAYPEIKAMDPDAVVVSAGLTDMGNEDGVSISPADYVEYMYEAGAKDYFDALALHPYTYPGYDYGWPQVSAIWKIMDSSGDAGKKIWITEYGAPTGGSGRAVEIGGSDFSYGKDFMTEKSQSSMAESIFAFKASNPARIGNIFWYTLCDSSTDKSTTENFFGIIRYDGTKKAVYDTIKELLSRL